MCYKPKWGKNLLLSLREELSKSQIYWSYIFTTVIISTRVHHLWHSLANHYGICMQDYNQIYDICRIDTWITEVLAIRVWRITKLLYLQNVLFCYSFHRSSLCVTSPNLSPWWNARGETTRSVLATRITLISSMRRMGTHYNFTMWTRRRLDL